MSTLSEQLQLSHYWLREGNIEPAKALLLDMHQRQPDYAPAVELLARVWSHQEQPLRAIELLLSIVGEPTCPASALLLLGDLYLEQSKPHAAIQNYQAALQTSDPSFDVLHNLGLAYAQLFLFQEAVEAFEKASLFNQTSFELQLNWGAALKNLGQYQASLDHLMQAEKIAPLDPRVWLNKGTLFAALDQHIPAIECYEKVTQIDPGCIESHCNKANSLSALGKFDQAAVAFQSALALQPDDSIALFCLSHLQLLQGNYQEGWRNYEHRWQRLNAPIKPFTHLPELVDLKNLHNQKILIWSEQGLGDSIQFCRFLPKLAEMGAQITLATQTPLLELLSTLQGIHQVVDLTTTPKANYDAQIALLSLPYLFQKENIPFPLTIPYLKTDPKKSLIWHNRLQSEKKLKVGLVWSGGVRFTETNDSFNNRRNVPLELIARLRTIPSIQFYSLQKGELAETELMEKKSALWPSDNLIIFTAELKTFADTAALIENLDLVISVDTSTVHLAGALGKPVWLLNRFDSCWRWLIQQETSHWYPSARIFNQPNSGNWGAVLEQVAVQLKALSKK
jgi:tetratricopeptide (TPR) repeat protein